MDGGKVLSVQLASDRALVGEAVWECECYFRRRGAKDVLGGSVVITELVRNAIVHGNRNDRERFVNVGIEDLGEGRFRVEVRDEGEGFDYLALDTTLPDDPRMIEQRGYRLINALSEHLEFSNKGSTVAAHVDLGTHDSTGQAGAARGPS